MVTCNVSDDKGNVIKRSIKRSEITAEGLLLCDGLKSPLHRWLRSVGSSRLPLDMKILEKAATEILPKKTIPEDYVVWNIDSLLESYREYPDWVEMVNRKEEALFLFFERNGLLTCRVSDDQGRVVKRIIRNNERTAEGQLLCEGSKNAVDRWSDSKGSQKNPPDMKILEKALAEIRANKKT